MNALYNVPPLFTALPGSFGPLALALLVAHLAGDFVFQSDTMARGKRDLNTLFSHAAIHALLAYVAIGDWDGWELPLAVFVSHAVVDAIKVRVGRTQTAFWTDQAAHLAILAGIAAGAAGLGYACGWTDSLAGNWSAACVILSGAIVCVRVLAVVIGFWVEPYLVEIKTAGHTGDATGRDAIAGGGPRGLTNGGRTIGQWERALIFLLVLIGQPAGIGFLIAAKSIFRFGELMDRQNRMEAEYITIGTLMSFGSAIAVSFATLALVRLR
ncbi:MAG TPA: DUF3307 domain-containing protein [Opitutaceae bacterium]|nr:DUF3307 domain-containing protein [Opitutaceae bacterium]